ncbi:AI-2E family transporter [uncultured Clostridium sp.]|uniref:AI-2E family transporter n=1 Tax=uncultured Clostridium sp. TaxID=59620 RepID=UPI0028E56593|nr:AI-2E family transporter [uncultured Clostridium sp.]
MKLNIIKYKNIIIILGIIVFLFLFKFKITKQIFFVLFLSFICSYILRPLYQKLISIGINKSFAAFLLIMGLILILVINILFLIPILMKETSSIGDAIYQLEEVINGVYNKIKPIKNNRLFYNALQNLYLKANLTVDNIFNNIFEKTLKLGESFFTFTLVPILAYYFLVDSKDIYKVVITLFPLKSRKVLKKILEDIDKILCRYIVTQVILSIIIWIITFILLVLLKVQFPFMLSFLNAFFNIIPYFGPVFGALPAIIVALLKSPYTALWTAISLYLLQQLEGNIISPKIIGDNISIHPLVVIILLLLGGKLWGFLGMILAVPIGVIIKVIYENLNYYIF